MTDPPAPPELADVSSWPAERWDALAARSAGGHVFQSSAWASTKEPLGWTARRYTIGQAGRPVAVASVLARPLPGIPGRRHYLYVPRGPVLLEGNPQAARAALQALATIAHAGHAIALTVDPCWQVGGELAAALPEAGFRPAAHDVQVSRTAMLVPLSEDESAQHRLLSHSAANNLNRALRGGVVAGPVDASAPAALDEGLRDFHAMYATTGERAGFIVRDRAYLLAQWRALAQSGLASLWLASLDGRPQAGALLHHCGRTLVLAHAGSPDDAAMRSSQANYLLHWRIIRWAAENGFGQYDLGGVDTHARPGVAPAPGDDLWGLYVFKRAFGAEFVSYVPAHDHAPNPVLGVAWRVARSLLRR